MAAGVDAARCDKALGATVVDYWNERAITYSNGVRDELAGNCHKAWAEILREKLGFSKETGCSEEFRVLDLGCGPGFFSVLLSRMGVAVHAVDTSETMLARARENVAAAGRPELVEYLCADIASLPLPSESYDAVVLRNVTWLMQEPTAAYEEWKRLLRPGGKLVVFDANWYSYLADEALNQRREADQSDMAVLNWREDAFASEKQERRCEAIASKLPLTYEQRPSWDVKVLSKLGFAGVSADEDIYRRLWTKGEQAFYATSPLFVVEATK